MFREGNHDNKETAIIKNKKCISKKTTIEWKTILDGMKKFFKKRIPVIMMKHQKNEQS